MNSTNGWRRMTRRFSRQRVLGLLLLAPALAVQAQRAPDTEATASADARGSEDSQDRRVSLQLLEFLGEFTTEDGDWVDPELLMEGDIVGTARREMGTESGREAPAQGTDGTDEQPR
jgi:hypothetical protein